MMQSCRLHLHVTLKTGDSWMKYKTCTSKNEVFQHSYAGYGLNKAVLSSDETLLSVKMQLFPNKHFAYFNGTLKRCTSVCICF